MASVAALATNLNAVTFNAAGVVEAGVDIDFVSKFKQTPLGNLALGRLYQSIYYCIPRLKPPALAGQL